MSNPASNLIKQVARRFGIAISRYPAPGTLGQDLSDFLSRMNIDVVLDIGAYAGTYARELREVGYRGRIISFEPVPASYERLHRAMHNDPLWSGEPFGLSDENRETLINTHNSGDFNSLLTLREEAQVAYSVDPSRSSQIPIQLRRLDAVLPKLIEGIQSPRIFMKMDTQGHDLSVVKGASGVLNKIVGLQSELPAVEIYDGMPSMSAVLNYLASCGFVPTGFYPVNSVATSDGLRISPEFDVLFRRFDGRLAAPRSSQATAQ
jgi:FkbM family methyltransferase